MVLNEETLSNIFKRQTFEWVFLLLHRIVICHMEILIVKSLKTFSYAIVRYVKLKNKLSVHKEWPYNKTAIGNFCQQIREKKVTSFINKNQRIFVFPNVKGDFCSTLYTNNSVKNVLCQPSDCTRI